MQYSQNFIDEVVRACQLVDNKKFIARKYNVSVGTIQRWLTQHSSEFLELEYINSLKDKAEVVYHYDAMENKSLICKQYNIPKAHLDKTVNEYRRELFYRSSDYKTLIKDLNELKDKLELLRVDSDSELILLNLVKVNIFLNIPDEKIIEDYSVSQSFVDHSRSVLVDLD